MNRFSMTMLLSFGAAAALASAPGAHQAGAQSVQYKSPAGVEYRSLPDTEAVTKAQADLKADPRNVAKIIDPAELFTQPGAHWISDYEQPPLDTFPFGTMLVAPCTFNSFNKLAHGIADTLATSMVRKPPKPFRRMSFTAASSSRLRVVSLRSAWVRRGANLGSAELSLRDRSFWRGAGACNIPGLCRPVSFGSLVFDIDIFFDDFDRKSLERDRAGHARGLSARHVKGAEMPGAFDDLSGQDAFLRQ